MDNSLIVFAITVIAIFGLQPNNINSIYFGVMIFALAMFHPFISKPKEITHTKSVSINDLKNIAKLVVQDDKIKSRKMRIFEILSHVSKDFLLSYDPDVNKITNLIKEITTELNFKRGYLFKIDNDGENFVPLYTYTHNSKKINKLQIKFCNTLTNKMKSKTIITKMSELPAFEQTFFIGIKTLILIPIHVDDRLTGFMGFDTDREKEWDKNEIDSLKMVADIFSAWCSRIRMYRKLVSK